MMRSADPGAELVGCVMAGTTRLAVLVLVVVLGMSSLACSKEAPEDVESETVVPVTTAPAQTGAITTTIRAPGIITPAPGAELIVVAPEPARILAIPKAEGDVVHRGDVLVQFEIPSSEAEASKQRAEIGRAQARLVNAEAAHARANDLFGRGVAARKQVEDAARDVADAEADLASARAAAAAAEAVASRSVVRAIFEGVVARRLHNPGDLVEPSSGDAVLRVIDPHRLEVQAAVAVADASRLMVGAAARFADATAGRPAASLKVISRPVAVEPGTASVPVRLAFTAPVTFPAGMAVQIEIDAETKPSVVLVPVMAVVHEGEGAAVFVVSGDVARRRVVTTGLESHDLIEITSGLHAGEAVVVDGQNGLPDGAKVSNAQDTRGGAPAAGHQDK